jgi:hypothetical protein
MEILMLDKDVCMYVYVCVVTLTMFCPCPPSTIVGGVAAKLGEEEVAVFNTSYR